MLVRSWQQYVDTDRSDPTADVNYMLLALTLHFVVFGVGIHRDALPISISTSNSFPNRLVERECHKPSCCVMAITVYWR